MSAFRVCRQVRRCRVDALRVFLAHDCFYKGVAVFSGKYVVYDWVHRRIAVVKVS